jgi:hypothetical protein
MGALPDEHDEILLQDTSQIEKWISGKTVQVCWLTNDEDFQGIHHMVKIRGKRRRSEGLINFFLLGYYI